MLQNAHPLTILLFLHGATTTTISTTTAITAITIIIGNFEPTAPTRQTLPFYPLDQKLSSIPLPSPTLHRHHHHHHHYHHQHTNLLESPHSLSPSSSLSCAAKASPSPAGGVTTRYSRLHELTQTFRTWIPTG